eukprot:1368477-Ditylum_brightwellii.AAC.1
MHDGSGGKKPETKKHGQTSRGILQKHTQCLEDSTAINMEYGTANMISNNQDDLKEALGHLANTSIHNKMTVVSLAQANKMLP